MSESPDTRGAWGAGLATASERSGEVLDTLYPAPALGSPPIKAEPGTSELDAHGAAEIDAEGIGHAAGRDPLRGVRTAPVITYIPDLGAPPADVHDAYLRLQLLSHRLVAPREMNLDGLFGVLPNVVWTSAGPCEVEDFAGRAHALLGARRELAVTASTSSRG